MNIYTHVLPEIEREAIDGAAKVIFECRGQPDALAALLAAFGRSQPRMLPTAWASRLRRSAPSAWTWNRPGQAISTAWPTSH